MNPSGKHKLGTDSRLSGSIERIVYHQEESSYTVIRVKVGTQKNPMTVVGYTVPLTEGELIECEGEWVNNASYGRQFQASRITVKTPHTEQGIMKYLCSGRIKGIGPHFAKRLVEHFGSEVLNIIEQTPERLFEIDGIGKKRIEGLSKSWNENRSIHEIMLFLHEHGFGSQRAARIHRRYGADAIALIKKNPYRLYREIHGIGFKLADELAQKLGMAHDAPERIKAGMEFALSEASSQGHCALQRTTLTEHTAQTLQIDETIVEPCLNESIEEKQLIKETTETGELIYSRPLHRAEKGVCKEIIRLTQSDWRNNEIDIEKLLKDIQFRLNIQLSFSQKHSVEMVTKHKMTVITGGPGVGKTTVIRTIVNIIESFSTKITLCAPTGRAAKRMSESTHRPAVTIHRLLGVDPITRQFNKNEDNPLDTDFIIIDECSMIDIHLAHQLLKAVPNHAGVLWVGDIDQLPSVGPGSFLKDIIESGTIPSVALTEIFRQASNSNIIINAHRVNSGKMPFTHEDKKNTDFFILYEEDPVRIIEKIKHMIAKRIPASFGLDPIEDIQCLTPMNRGPLGTASLNAILQETLNPNHEYIERYGQRFAVGDKVIQMRNNYEKDIFNGDLGFIQAIHNEDRRVTVSVDQRFIEYEFDELDELQLAYATSIHKSQGSEYPCVLIPMVTAHFMLLDKNLLYTAMTRGKKLVIFIGQKKALAMGVHQDRSTKRITHLKHRLRSCLSVTNTLLSQQGE